LLIFFGIADGVADGAFRSIHSTRDLLCKNPKIQTHLLKTQRVIQTTIHNHHYTVHSSSVADGVADGVGVHVGEPTSTIYCRTEPPIS